MAARTRAKDSDRDETCRILDTALAEGQLTGEEHRRRVTAAVTATTLGDLLPLVGDLQVSTSTLQSPKRPGSRRKRDLVIAGIGIGAAVLITGVVFVSARDGSSPSVTQSSPVVPVKESPVSPVAPSPAPPPTPADTVAPTVLALPREFGTAEGMSAVIDQIRQRFGDTMGYELAISPDQAMLARPNPADDTSKLVYTFRGGWGDPSVRPRTDTDDLTDLAAFDVDVAAAALASAPATLKIPPENVSSTYLDIDHIAQPPGAGALELLVKISQKSGGPGYVYLSGDGTVKRVEYPS